MEEVINKIVDCAKLGITRFSFDDQYQILSEVIEQLEAEKDTCMQMQYWVDNENADRYE